MESTLLERLSDLAGRCAPRRLGFMIGPVPSVESPTVAPKPATTGLPVEAPPTLVAAAQVIPDLEARQAFVASASLYLLRIGAGPRIRR
jgi:hypothetical protein